MAEEPTATARFRAELTGAWAEFLASLFFVFFGAGSVCGAVKAVGEPVVVEVGLDEAPVRLRLVREAADCVVGRVERAV